MVRRALGWMVQRKSNLHTAPLDSSCLAFYNTHAASDEPAQIPQGGTALALDEQPENQGGLIGRTLGGYVLIGLLGVGGMAEVYRGQDRQLKREVAVKVLPTALAKDASYVARFRAEAQRTAAFVHPNVVPVYDYGEQDGLLYLVMPVLPTSVRDRLDREGAFEPLEAARLAYQVAAALDAAHRRGLVHRDVKPENILLGADGRAMLTDFGIARELDVLQSNTTNQTLSVTGLPVGTPEYMAPEQLRNQPLDQRIDIYSLGIVLFEMLTGTVPHDAETPYAVAARVLKEEVPPPSTLKPQVWPALDVVVLNAVAKNPDERYPNMRSFAMDLRTAASHGARAKPRWIPLEKTSDPAIEATRLPPASAPFWQSPSRPLGRPPSQSVPPSTTIPIISPTSAPVYVPGGGTPPLPAATSLPLSGYATGYTSGYPVEEDTSRLPAAVPARFSLQAVAIVLVAVLALGAVAGFALLKGFPGGSGGPTTAHGAGGVATSTAASGTPDHNATRSGSTGTTTSMTPSGGGTVGPTATASLSTAHIKVASSTVSLADINGICTGSQTLTNDGPVDATWSWSGLPPNGQAQLKYSPNPKSPQILARGQSVTITISGSSPPCTNNSPNSPATVTVNVTNGSASPASFKLNY